MPGNVKTGIWRIGTSGWSYPSRSGSGSWTGVFYPLRKTDELEFYSRYFNTVEVNSTFYDHLDLLDEADAVPVFIVPEPLPDSLAAAYPTLKES